MSDTFQRIKEIVVDQLGVEEGQVTMEASFINDLGADSLDQANIVNALEESFGVEIPDSDAEKIATVGQAVEYVDKNKK